MQVKCRCKSAKTKTTRKDLSPVCIVVFQCGFTHTYGNSGDQAGSTAATGVGIILSLSPVISTAYIFP